MKRFALISVAVVIAAFLALIGIGIYVEHEQGPVHNVAEPKAGKLATLLVDIRAIPQVETVRMVNPRPGAIHELDINDGDAFVLITKRGATVGGYKWKDDLVDAVNKTIAASEIPGATLTSEQERRLLAAR